MGPVEPRGSGAPQNVPDGQKNRKPLDQKIDSIIKQIMKAPSLLTFAKLGKGVRTIRKQGKRLLGIQSKAEIKNQKTTYLKKNWKQFVDISNKGNHETKDIEFMMKYSERCADQVDDWDEIFDDEAQQYLGQWFNFFNEKSASAPNRQEFNSESLINHGLKAGSNERFAEPAEGKEIEGVFQSIVSSVPEEEKPLALKMETLPQESRITETKPLSKSLIESASLKPNEKIRFKNGEYVVKDRKEKTVALTDGVHQPTEKSIKVVEEIISSLEEADLTDPEVQKVIVKLSLNPWFKESLALSSKEENKFNDLLADVESLNSEGCRVTKLETFLDILISGFDIKKDGEHFVFSPTIRGESYDASVDLLLEEINDLKEYLLISGADQQIMRTLDSIVTNILAHINLVIRFLGKENSNSDRINEYYNRMNAIKNRLPLELQAIHVQEFNKLDIPEEFSQESDFSKALDALQKLSKWKKEGLPISEAAQEKFNDLLPKLCEKQENLNQLMIEQVDTEVKGNKVTDKTLKEMARNKQNSKRLLKVDPQNRALKQQLEQINEQISNREFLKLAINTETYQDYVGSHAIQEENQSIHLSQKDSPLPFGLTIAPNHTYIHMPGVFVNTGGVKEIRKAFRAETHDVVIRGVIRPSVNGVIDLIGWALGNNKNRAEIFLKAGVEERGAYTEEQTAEIEQLIQEATTSTIQDSKEQLQRYDALIHLCEKEHCDMKQVFEFMEENGWDKKITQNLGKLCQTPEEVIRWAEKLSVEPRKTLIELNQGGVVYNKLALLQKIFSGSRLAENHLMETYDVVNHNGVANIFCPLLPGGELDQSIGKKLSSRGFREEMERFALIELRNQSFDNVDAIYSYVELESKKGTLGYQDLVAYYKKCGETSESKKEIADFLKEVLDLPGMEIGISHPNPILKKKMTSRDFRLMLKADLEIIKLIPQMDRDLLEVMTREELEVIEFRGDPKALKALDSEKIDAIYRYVEKEAKNGNNAYKLLKNYFGDLSDNNKKQEFADFIQDMLKGEPNQPITLQIQEPKESLTSNRMEEVARDSLAALNACHEEKIIFGDHRGGNEIFDSAGNIVLIDTDSVIFYPKEDAFANERKDLRHVGLGARTEKYTADDYDFGAQVGDFEYHKQRDVYAWGFTVYRMFEEGYPDYLGDSFQEKYDQARKKVNNEESLTTLEVAILATGAGKYDQVDKSASELLQLLPETQG